MTHKMERVNEYPSGAQEWRCPICGYWIILQWPPKYKKITLDEGDPQVSHSGSIGEIIMDRIEMKNNAMLDEPFEEWVEKNKDLFNDMHTPDQTN